MESSIFSLFWGIFGLIIGSFLNVVIFRLPRGESIMKPGSHCPECGHFLKAWELFPVLSFLVLRGRCHECGTKISWRYPAVELFTGLLFFYWTWQNPFSSLPNLFLHFCFLAVLLALALIDWDTFRLPDVLTLPLLLLGIVGAFLLPGGPSEVESLVSAIGAGGFFWLIAKFYPQGMGLGDVKLIAALGAFLGFPKILLALFLASLAGSILGLLWMMVRGKGFRAQIPFGPYLVLGAYIALFWGDSILRAYLTLF